MAYLALSNKNRTGVSSGKRTFLNFSTMTKFPIVVLPELTPKFRVVLALKNHLALPVIFNAIQTKVGVYFCLMFYWCPATT
jgi:hypothetical protein